MKDDLLKYFIEEQKAPYGVCSVAFVYGDKVEYHSGAGCHGVLHSIQKGITGVYTSLWRNKAFSQNDSVAEKFWDFLFDKEISPYRQALTNFEVLRDKDGKPVAFGILDMKVPIQVAAALLIQTRIPFEAPYNAVAFNKWCEAGFSPTEAYYLMLVLTFTSNETLTVRSFGGAAHSLMVDIKKLHTGEPVGLSSRTWQKGSSDYTPVSSPWDGKSMPVVTSLLTTDFKYQGAFKKMFDKIGLRQDQKKQLVSFSKAVDILKKNRGQWSYQE